MPVLTGGRPAGSLLGGVSELAVKVSALLAWLATALRAAALSSFAGCSPGAASQADPTAVPPAVIVGHAGFGVFGLVLWIAFMATGVTALAWISVGIMAPVAGLGMGVLMLGLPSPRPGPRLLASVAEAPALAPRGSGHRDADRSARRRRSRRSRRSRRRGQAALPFPGSRSWRSRPTGYSRQPRCSWCCWRPLGRARPQSLRLSRTLKVRGPDIL